jgi:hypothetical protein
MYLTDLVQKKQATHQGGRYSNEPKPPWESLPHNLSNNVLLLTTVTNRKAKTIGVTGAGASAEVLWTNSKRAKSQ